VGSAPVWKRRRVRGAPVGGNPDGAPVHLARRIQVKVYRGEGSDARLPLRVVHTLRSINRVPPVINSEPSPRRGPECSRALGRAGDSQPGRARIGTDSPERALITRSTPRWVRFRSSQFSAFFQVRMFCYGGGQTRGTQPANGAPDGTR
jgi:hypothetical protein